MSGKKKIITFQFSLVPRQLFSTEKQGIVSHKMLGESLARRRYFQLEECSNLAPVLCTCVERRVDLGDGRDSSSGLSPPPLLRLPYCYQAALLRGIPLRLQLTTHLLQTTTVSRALYSEVCRQGIVIIITRLFTVGWASSV